VDIRKSYKTTPKGDLQPVEALLKTMLENGMVDTVLGAKSDKDITQIKPEQIGDPENISDMNMNAYIAFNFSKMDSAAKFVHKTMGGGLRNRIGMFGRSCDVRALVELRKRHQVDFNNLIVIGIEEFGQIEQKTLKAFFTSNSLDPTQLSTVRMGRDQMEMDFIGDVQSYPLDSELHVCHNCANCHHKSIQSADVIASFLAGEPVLTALTEKGLTVLEKADAYLEFTETTNESEGMLKEMEAEGRNRQLADIEEFRQKTKLEKMQALGACTACGLCIKSCPVCFCVDCSLQNKRKAKEIDVYTFQLSRLAHIGDSCVQCGKCDSNCPKNLPLNIYLNDIAFNLEEKFGYVTGRSFDDIPPRASISDLKLRFKK
jgi:formate dehydrogenase subunit beta